jgi:hypothetical protein
MSGRALYFVIGFVLVATSAPAAEPWIGRWSVDQETCNGTSASAIWPLLVTEQALRWPTALCTVSTSYRVGNAWYVSGRCWGEGVVSTIPIRFQMRGDRLAFDWGRARTEELRRCP